MAIKIPKGMLTVETDSLIPYARNARTHSAAQIAAIAGSMQEFGWTNPILVQGTNIIAGHGRILAARKLGLKKVPVIELSHLSAAQRRAYVLADNAIALQSGWDKDLLALELGELRGVGFDLDVTGLDLEVLKIDIKEVGEPNQSLTERDYGGATSIGRSAAPIRHWRSAGLLKGDVLDFGCGQETHDWAKYDIVHYPDPAVLLRQYDTVMCNYVLNVQPAEHLITQILVQLWHLARGGGKVLVSVRNDVEKTGATSRGYQLSLTHAQWSEKVARVLVGCEGVRGSSFSGFIYSKPVGEAILPAPRASFTLPADLRRDGRAGKRMGDELYVHKSAVDVMPEQVQDAIKAAKPGFDWAIAKAHRKTGSISLIECTDWDTADEPTVGRSYLVKQRRTVRPAGDPWIYHHKWMFVRDDYPGFDLAASKARSAAWYSLPGVDKARIGKRSYWVANVAPRIP